MRMVGAGGAAWAGSYVAASLGAWRLARADDASWTLVATIADRDAYWITQPLTRVQVTVAGRTWCWREGSIHVDGDQVRAVLGTPDHL